VFALYVRAAGGAAYKPDSDPRGLAMGAFTHTDGATRGTLGIESYDPTTNESPGRWRKIASSRRRSGLLCKKTLPPSVCRGCRPTSSGNSTVNAARDGITYHSHPGASSVACCVPSTMCSTSKGINGYDTGTTIPITWRGVRTNPSARPSYSTDLPARISERGDIRGRRVKRQGYPVANRGVCNCG